MASAIPAGHNIALSAFVNEDRHFIAAFFALAEPSSIKPALMGTFMIKPDISYKCLNTLFANSTYLIEIVVFSLLLPSQLCGESLFIRG
jgi:hypothetical protein